MQAALHKVFTQFSSHFPDTPFILQDWTGATQSYGEGDPKFTLRINTPNAIKQTLRNAALGFGEAYMDGEIEVEGDLQALLRFQEAPFFSASDLTFSEKIRFLIATYFTRNTITQVKKNVHHHYDLGNDFYRLWLDKTMTYTCAYFRDANDTIEQAQWNKHDHLCRKLRLKPGQTLVDIGCGWGAMLFHAAENYGVIATGYTISQEQHDWLQKEIKARGLEGRVFVKLQDYRDVTEKYDRWVSIGMAEQIGKEFIQVYFDSIKRTLKPGGVGVLHTIGTPISYPNNPWLEKYIFPGGYIPTLGEMTAAMGNLQLNPTDIEDLRLHYGQTLDHWYKRFSEHIDTITKMYDERFVRMWTLYLQGSATTFRYGRSRLFQIAFTNGLDNDQPRTREYIYNTAPPPRSNGYHKEWDFQKTITKVKSR